MLNAKDTAEVIVDALIDAKIVNKDDLDKAIDIVKEELQVRIDLADYK